MDLFFKIPNNNKCNSIDISKKLSTNFCKISALYTNGLANPGKWPLA